MSTQELLNTMVASQIQLREDMNLIVKQFQNMNNGQEGDNIDQTSPIIEHEKRINEKINKGVLELPPSFCNSLGTIYITSFWGRTF